MAMAMRVQITTITDHVSGIGTIINETVANMQMHIDLALRSVQQRATANIESQGVVRVR